MKIDILTGASSGLGAEFAYRAKDCAGGLDELWLIARRTEKLHAVEQKISGCRVRCLSLDQSDRESGS